MIFLKSRPAGFFCLCGGEQVDCRVASAAPAFMQAGCVFTPRTDDFLTGRISNFRFIRGNAVGETPTGSGFYRWVSPPTCENLKYTLFIFNGGKNQNYFYSSAALILQPNFFNL
ncbi:hypothetical protein [Parafilimonas sp.]|uniref:hypothetical protein n=1 Tax=Parafilimonas sp. TaxID=1969739 RepID=UPI0039E623B2